MKSKFDVKFDVEYDVEFDVEFLGFSVVENLVGVVSIFVKIRSNFPCMLSSSRFGWTV